MRHAISGTHARTAAATPATQPSPGAAPAAAAGPQRTDSRTLIERKVSVQMRIAELRKALRDAEAADAEITAQIEAAERARERGGYAHV